MHQKISKRYGDGRTLQEQCDDVSLLFFFYDLCFHEKESVAR